MSAMSGFMSVMSRITDSLDKLGYWQCPRCHLVQQQAPAKCPHCSGKKDKYVWKFLR